MFTISMYSKDIQKRPVQKNGQIPSRMAISAQNTHFSRKNIKKFQKTPIQIKSFML